jgi:DNA polymerase-4
MGVSNIYHSEAQERKSISRSKTFKATSDIKELHSFLEKLAFEVEEKSKRYKFVGRGISISVKSSSFQTTQKSTKMADFTNSAKILLNYAKDLFQKANVKEPIRLLGIRLDDLKKEEAIKKNNIFNYFAKVETAKQNHAKKAKNGAKTGANAA